MYYLYSFISNASLNLENMPQIPHFLHWYMELLCNESHVENNCSEGKFL